MTANRYKIEMTDVLALSDKDFKAAIKKCFEKKSYFLLKKLKWKISTKTQKLTKKNQKFIKLKKYLKQKHC